MKAIIFFMIMLICSCVRVGAAPVSFSGDFTHQVQRTVYADGTSANNIETTTFLYANWPVDAKVTLFGRYGYEHFGGDEDHIAARYQLDQYGVRWVPDKKTRLAIGKQGAYMGTYSGLVSIGGTAGQGMVDGLDFQHTTNDSALHMIAGQFDRRLFGDAAHDAAAYGMEFGERIGQDQLTAGYLWLKNDACHYYSTGLVHPAGKAQFTAEYVFSTAAAQKEGVIYGVSYSLGEHDGISITTHHLKAQAVSAISGYSNATASTAVSWGHSWRQGYFSVSYEKVHNLSDHSRYHTTTMAYSRSW